MYDTGSNRGTEYCLFSNTSGQITNRTYPGHPKVSWLGFPKSHQRSHTNCKLCNALYVVKPLTSSPVLDASKKEMSRKRMARKRSFLSAFTMRSPAVTKRYRRAPVTAPRATTTPTYFPYIMNTQTYRLILRWLIGHVYDV